MYGCLPCPTLKELSYTPCDHDVIFLAKELVNSNELSQRPLVALPKDFLAKLKEPLKLILRNPIPERSLKELPGIKKQNNHNLGVCCESWSFKKYIISSSYKQMVFDFFLEFWSDLSFPGAYQGFWRLRESLSKNLGIFSGLRRSFVTGSNLGLVIQVNTQKRNPPPVVYFWGACLHNAYSLHHMWHVHSNSYMYHCATPWLKTCSHSR